MEITWNNISRHETAIKKSSIFHNYDFYVIGQNYNNEELANVLGRYYFTDEVNELYIDKIAEMFLEMISSVYSNGMTDHYRFLIFLFKKQLYNKVIDKNEALAIFNKYIVKNEVYSDFVYKLISYKMSSEEDQSYVYDTFIEYIRELKYN